MMPRPRIEHEHEHEHEHERRTPNAKRQTVNAERFLAAPGFSR